MSYNVVINEYQRQMLVKLARLAKLTSAFDLKAEAGEHEPNMYEEATVLIVMLESLPKEEASHPGIIHGLCL